MNIRPLLFHAGFAAAVSFFFSDNLHAQNDQFVVEDLPTMTCWEYRAATITPPDGSPPDILAGGTQETKRYTGGLVIFKGTWFLRNTHAPATIRSGMTRTSALGTVRRPLDASREYAPCCRDQKHASKQPT